MTDLSHRWPAQVNTVPMLPCAAQCTLVTETRKQRGCSRARRMMCRAEVAEHLYNYLTKSNLAAESLFQISLDPIVETGRLEVMGYATEARFLPTGHARSFWYDVARRYGLMVELDLAVIRASLRALARLPGAPFISLEISRETLDDPRTRRLLMPQAAQIVLQIQGNPDDPLTVEAHDLLQELQGLGLRLGVDLRDDTSFDTVNAACSRGTGDQGRSQRPPRHDFRPGSQPQNLGADAEGAHIQIRPAGLRRPHRRCPQRAQRAGHSRPARAGVGGTDPVQQVRQMSAVLAKPAAPAPVLGNPCSDCEHAIACALVRPDYSQCLRAAEVRMDRGLLLSWLVFLFLCIALAAIFFL